MGCRLAPTLPGVWSFKGLRPGVLRARPTRMTRVLVEVHGMSVLSRCGALTTCSSRTRFAPPATWQVKLATWPAPLRTPAQLRC